MTSQDEQFQKSTEAARVFTPSAPVSESDLFAGRMAQMRKVVDVIVQRGQHAIVFGERGVGKTSLARVLSSLVLPHKKLLTPMVNCESADTFVSLWRKVFSQLDLITRTPQIGFQSRVFEETVKAADMVGDDIDPDAVRRLLTILSQEALVLVIFDEFDRLEDPDAKRALADTIKALSDNAVEATILLVGVAQSVSELIAEHESIERALVQIQMPRMSTEELGEILDKGAARLNMEIAQDAKSRIVRLSRGLPHYTHSLGLHATRASIDKNQETVLKADVDRALQSALEEVNLSLRSAYDKCVFSPHKETIYAHVLMACALAPAGDFGYFTPASVREPLSAIRGKAYRIPAFAKHVTSFSTESRGEVLQKEGVKRRFRFRFSNPLMQPFVVMKGVAMGIISEDALKRFGS
ncbi:MAG: AAA family ATPase [Acidobacteria bacterium]|nr:AAA family ATPase [Acidobacteriota bacterium]